MTSAWCFFYDPKAEIYKLEHRNVSTKLESTKAEDWGLPEGCLILLVLQAGQFIDAWVYGEKAKKL